MLNDSGVEYALVGGYAIAAHGFNRFSEDIDILVNPAAENSQRWIVALSAPPDQYSSSYYGAFVFDLDGNKIEAVTGV